MSEFALRLQNTASLEGTLSEVTASALRALPVAEFAGIGLIASERRVTMCAATDPVVAVVDSAQLEAGEGPALTAVTEQRDIAVDDISSECRWPVWRARVGSTAICSILCLNLSTPAHRLASLNLYARQRGAFDAEAHRIGRLFAAQAATALASAKELEDLHRALTSRDCIGMAKGILIERFRVTPDQAFQRLVKGSQISNTKLSDLAALVVATGLPPEQAASC